MNGNEDFTIARFCANVSWISKFGTNEKEWLLPGKLGWKIKKRYFDAEIT